MKTFVLSLNRSGFWEAREAGKDAVLTFGAEEAAALEQLGRLPAVSVGDRVDVIRRGRRTTLTLRERIAPEAGK